MLNINENWNKIIKKVNSYICLVKNIVHFFLYITSSKLSTRRNDSKEINVLR